MKIGVALLLLLLGFIAGAIATHFYKERSVTDARARVAEKQAALDSLKSIIERDSANLRQMQERFDIERDSLENIIDETEIQRKAKAAEADSLADELEGQLPDHLRPTFIRLREAHKQEVSLLEAELLAKDAIIVSQDTLIRRYINLNATLTQALTRSEELREYWEDEAKRDWWEKPQFTAPLAVGATVATAIVVKSLVE